MKKSLSIADLMMLGGAAIVFLFSFVAFNSFGPFSSNAWDGDSGAFATTVPAILALVLLVWSGLELFGVAVPDKVLTFTSPQLKATWAISSAGVLLSWATVDNRAGLFWLQLLAGLVMAAGAVAALLGQLTDPVIKVGADKPAPGPSSEPPPYNPGQQQSPPPPYEPSAPTGQAPPPHAAPPHASPPPPYNPGQQQQPPPPSN